jgi:hypothetical protein
VGLLAASLTTQAACSSAPASSNVAASPVHAASSPTPVALLPRPVASPRPRPSTTRAVAFSGLRPGTYPAHLHSRCHAGQGFHITVLQNLRVANSGVGFLEIPRSYFGRGLCVIIYSNPSLSAALATRPI